MELSDGDGLDAGPVFNITLAIKVGTNGADGAVGTQERGVTESVTKLDVRFFLDVLLVWGVWGKSQIKFCPSLFESCPEVDIMKFAFRLFRLHRRLPRL